MSRNMWKVDPPYFKINFLHFITYQTPHLSSIFIVPLNQTTPKGNLMRIQIIHLKHETLCCIISVHGNVYYYIFEDNVKSVLSFLYSIWAGYASTDQQNKQVISGSTTNSVFWFFVSLLFPSNLYFFSLFISLQGNNSKCIDCYMSNEI